MTAYYVSFSIHSENVIIDCRFSYAERIAKKVLLVIQRAVICKILMSCYVNVVLHLSKVIGVTFAIGRYLGPGDVSSRRLF